MAIAELYQFLYNHLGEEVFDLSLNDDCEIELRLVNSQRFKIKVTDIVQTKYSMQEERAKECLGKFR